MDLCTADMFKQRGLESDWEEMVTKGVAGSVLCANLTNGKLQNHIMDPEYAKMFYISISECTKEDYCEKDPQKVAQFLSQV